MRAVQSLDYMYAKKVFNGIKFEGVDLIERWHRVRRCNITWEGVFTGASGHQCVCFQNQMYCFKETSNIVVYIEDNCLSG